MVPLASHLRSIADPALCRQALLLLADNAAKGAVLPAAAAVVATLLRWRGAATRHLVWLMALVSLLLLPITSSLLPAWKLVILQPQAPAPGAESPQPIAITPRPQAAPANSIAATDSGESDPASGSGSQPPPAFTPAPNPPVAPMPPRQVPIAAARAPIPWQFWIILLWLMGTTALLLRLAIGFASVAARRRAATPLLDDRWKTLATCRGRRVPLLLSSRSAMPMATGLLRPTIMLPVEAAAWPAEKMRVVLLHELAHVRRRDCLTQAIAQVALAVHWFDPLVVLAVRRLTIERERACDDAVLAAGTRPSTYAAYLLEIARRLHAPALHTAAAVPMARRSQLENRLAAILDSARPRGLATRRSVLLAGVATLALLVPLASLRPARAQAKPPPSTRGYSAITPASSPTATIVGIVADESGRPLAGMVVRAMHTAADGAAAERKKATTDAAGHFSFPSLAPGFWSFSVNDPRYAFEWDYEKYLTVPAEPEQLPLRLTLNRPRTITATVVDNAGKPVAGVRVALVSQLLPNADRRTWDHFDHEFLATTTDAAGRFTMSRLRPGQTILILEHDGYANTLVPLDADTPPRVITIHIGLTLHGRVLHDGKPQPGVHLLAGMTEDDHPMFDWHGVSDADGRFEVPHIPPYPLEQWSKAEVAFLRTDDPAWSSDGYGIYQTGPDTLPPVVVQVHPIRPGQPPVAASGVEVGIGGQSSTGAVRVMLPGLRGQPTVMAFPYAEGGMPQNRVATTQPVVLSNLPPGKYRIDTFNNEPPDPARIGKSVTVVAGQTLDVTLQPGNCQLRGTVRSGGQIVAGGPKTWISWFKYPPGIKGPGDYQGGVHVQPDGTYLADGLVPGEYEVIFETPGSMGYLTMAHVRPGGNRCDIDLPTGRIEGRIVGVSPAKRPNLDDEIPGISVQPRGFPPAMPYAGGAGVDPRPDGTFTITHVAPGGYTAIGNQLAATVAAATVVIDHPGAMATATLQPPQNTGDIAGLVTGHLPANLGDAFGAVYISAFPKDALGYDLHDWHQTTLDATSHRYRLTNLPAGTYGVLVKGAPDMGGALAMVWIGDVDVRAGMSRDLPIAVSAGREVQIRTADQLSHTGTIPTATAWQLQVPDGDWLDGDAIDGFDFCLAPGRYAARAQFGPHGPIVVQRFTIEPGEGVQKVVIAPPSAPPR